MVVVEAAAAVIIIMMMTTREELGDLDDNTRKLMALHRALHSKK